MLLVVHSAVDLYILVLVVAGQTACQEASAVKRLAVTVKLLAEGRTYIVAVSCVFVVPVVMREAFVVLLVQEVAQRLNVRLLH